MDASMQVARRFAENLTRARKRADLSQDELGIRASLHRTEVSQLERGLRVARIDTLIKLASGLSVRPEELLDGIDWQPGTVERGGFEVAPSPGATP